ncbi:MAG TPA: hypothetical protein VLA39_09150 [Marinobacterium sp.]|nr:hypothetical protein [Marinobacterium sp.]
MNLSPHEMNMLITSSLIFALIAFMVFIVLKDLVLPSKMSRFGVFLIVGVLLTAPLVFLAKNIYVVTASFNL